MQWNAANPDNALVGATAIFGGGIAHMIDDIIPGSYSILNSLLVLTYSAFCLTSLDTATRLARFMFQEFWLEPGETAADVKEGWKKVMVNPYFATILTVVLGILLGMNGYGKIWGLFGAANQLLAALVLIALAVFLKTTGRTGWTLYIPMFVMLAVTFTALIQKTIALVSNIAGGQATFLVDGLQFIVAILLMVLGVLVAFSCLKKLFTAKKQEA